MREFEGFYKGINLGGWLSQCRYEKVHYDTFITEEDIRQIASWGLDHVRLPISYRLIEAGEGVYLEEGFSYIDQCIYWCQKYKLKLILDLHSTAGYSFSEQINDGTDRAAAFLTNEQLIRRFLKLWEAIAARYRAKTDMLAFEVLNEMVDPSGGKAWNRLAKRAYETIRAILPDAKIIIGSNMWNSINTLQYLEKPYDENVVYTFHFYEPMLFTHQKAPWMDQIPKDIETPYPAAREEYQKRAEIAGNFALMDVKADRVDLEYLEELIKIALETGEKYNVSLYCGEYGVINRTDTDSTLNWYRDLHLIMEKYHISRAAWTYKEMDFGITDSHPDSVREELIRCL